VGLRIQPQIISVRFVGRNCNQLLGNWIVKSPLHLWGAFLVLFSLLGVLNK